MKQKYYKGHLIQKKWGQIFLHDKNIIDTIIQIINPKKNQNLIEIGPGLGALTEKILHVIDFLTVIERDTNLVKKLNYLFNKKKIKIYNEDVMKTNFSNLLTINKKKLRLIGNLPYSIASKFIIHLFKYRNIIQDMHFMLQKEVAQRLSSNPNKKEYGRLSIITQYHYQIIPLLQIPPTCFSPQPKVQSTFIRLLPHKHPIYPKVDIKQLSALTKLAFKQRRKTIQKNLSGLFNINELIQHGIDTTLRAENLTINQYCSLINILKKSKSNILL